MTTNQDRYLNKLKTSLRIPSVSTVPERRGDTVRAAEFVASQLEFTGLEQGEPFPLRKPYIAMIWTYEKDGYLGMIMGFANGGIAGVPGVLRVTVESPEGKKLASGCLDPGYPLPGKIRQGQFILPKGTKWQGLKLRAELEIKGIRRPIPWACHQKTEADGSLSLRPNGRHLS